MNGNSSNNENYNNSLFPISTYRDDEETLLSTQSNISKPQDGDRLQPPASAVKDPYTIEFDGELLFIDSNDWRKSNLLKVQILASYAIFILFGLAEQTVGTLIPKFQEYYKIGDAQTSLIFLASTSGYILLALVNEPSHSAVGCRGVVTFGSTAMSLAYLIISSKPPFWILVICYIFVGLGLGSLDAALNAWMGVLEDSNQLLGILHGCYGIGCMISPPLITNLLERKHNPWVWNEYYIVLSAVGAGCLILFATSFKYETAKKYKYSLIVKHKESAGNQNIDDIELGTIKQNFDTNDEEVTTTSDDEEIQPASLKESLKSKLVWFFSIILFIYVGGEVSFGSWIISFLMRVRKFSYKHSSYMATSFWTGLTVGRIFLGFATVRFFKNELIANFTYIVWSTLGYLAFYLLSFFKVDYIMFFITFITGVGVGPIFPTTIVASIKILPAKYHSSGVGFICAFGGGGSAALNFLIGLIADSSSLGLTIFPLIIMLLFVILSVGWAGLMKRYGSQYSSNRI